MTERAGHPTRDDFHFWITQQVRWGDADMLGHVNNAVFFTYSESARMAYYEQIIAPAADTREQSMILARTACDFVAQLTYPADLNVGARCTRIGRSSLGMQVGMFLPGQDTPVAVTDSVIVWFDYAKQATAPVPERVRAAIAEREPGLKTGCLTG